FCNCLLYLQYPIFLNQRCNQCLLYQRYHSPHCQPHNLPCLNPHCLHFLACQQCL
ncbi:hypothetical protein D5086_030265, partial [Populus alba]